MSPARSLSTFVSGLTLSLALAAPAQAADWDRAIARAERVMPGPVQCEPLRYTYVPTPQGNHVGYWDLKKCTIYVLKSQYGPYTTPELCQILAHELGHAQGLEHSRNPRSVMYAYITGRYHRYCRGRW